jgi:hypothetical protein
LGNGQTKKKRQISLLDNTLAATIEVKYQEFAHST